AADHKVVIQVSANDPIAHTMSINTAKNLKNLYGKDAVDVEIVVFGPGVTLLKASSSTATEVKELMTKHDVKVTVCEGTLKVIAKHNGGEAPNIVEGVAKVPEGSIHVIGLQEKGYSYIRL
ncbi:MAG: DsrE family protein, partial [Thiotrichaceae bacterium]